MALSSSWNVIAVKKEKKKFTADSSKVLIEAEYFECVVPFYFYAAPKFSVLLHNYVVLKLCKDGLDV